MALSQMWLQFDLWYSFLLLILYVAIDGMYAFYTIAVAHKKPFVAANTSFLMHFLVAIGVLSYVQNYLYVVPLAIGSWIGTFLVTKFLHKENLTD